MPPPLRLVSIDKRYGDVEVLKGVSFEVREAEAFGLLGANGSGKTSLNRIAVGLLRPDAGQVEVGGVSMASDPVGARRNMAYLAETSSLYPELSAEEILDFVAGTRGLGSDAAKSRAERLFRYFGLLDDARRAVGTYSLGMRRKVALACCLLSETPLLLLDEPTNGLDPPSVALFREVLQEWTRRGRSLLISSHILEFIEKTCHRVGILHKGRILACGTLDELREEFKLPGADLERIYLEVTGQRPESAKSLLDDLAA